MNVASIHITTNTFLLPLSQPFWERGVGGEGGGQP
jgi:hypothetical protein